MRITNDERAITSLQSQFPASLTGGHLGVNINGGLSAVETKLDTINTSLGNIKLDVDTLEVNTDGLETLLTTSNNATLRDINNTISIGDGSSNATCVSLGYDRTNGKGRAILVDSAGKIEVNNADTESLLTTIDGVLDASLVKQTNLETLITSTNSKIDTFDAVLDASLVKQTNIESLITTLDGVQDNALTKLGEIDTAIDTIDSVLDASLVKQTNLETLITSTNSKIDTFDAVLDASLVKQTNLETLITTLDGVQDNALTKLGEIDTAIDTIDSVLDASLVKQTSMDTHLSNAEAHLGNIDTGVDVLEACVGSNKVNVNISSGNISGFSTATHQTTIIGHLDGVEGLITSTNSKIDTFDAVLDASLVKQTNIESLITTLDGVQDNALTKLGEIDTAIDTIDSVLDASLVKQTSMDTHLSNAEAHLGNIDTGIDVLEACVGSNKVNVNISSGNISGFSTASNQTTIIGHLDGVEGLITSTNSKIDVFDAVLDASLVKQTNIETLITTLDGVQDNALTKLTEIDSVLDNIKVDTEAIETAVEILDDIVLTEDTAHSSGDKGVMFLGVHQSSQADFGADGDYVPMSINDDGELRVTSGSSSSATGQFLATSTTLSSYSLSSALDVSVYKNVRLMGKESGGSVSSIPVYGSQTTNGTYYALATNDFLNQVAVSESGSGPTFFMSANIENTPKFLKIFNNTGSDITIELDFVAHK